MMSQEIPSPREMCDRYCPRHPMSRCLGIKNHRRPHQCATCEVEGIRFNRTDNSDSEYRLRYFEYR